VEPKAEPPEVSPSLAPIPTEPPAPRRDGPRKAIPADVRRAVWARDGGCCSWPLDGGGRCGSTHLLELDHIDPWARFGEPTVANLRVVCRAHNMVAAKRVFGAACVERYARA
jgi:5-methylcytosine-specific restriction endonuclease McrA